MSDIVVDSSVVAKWVVPEPDSPQAHRVVTDTQAAGGRLIVLDLIYPEVVNVIWKKHRQKLASLEKAKVFFDDLKRVPVHVEPAARLLDQAFEIAVRYDRAVYDALFIALVQDIGVKGVTADEPLYNATHADFPQIVLLLIGRNRARNMDVFLLWHVHEMPDGEDDGKLIGVYASQGDAEKARQRSLSLLGFRDLPDVFIIDRYTVGEDNWTEGFVTETHEEIVRKYGEAVENIKEPQQ